MTLISETRSLGSPLRTKPKESSLGTASSQKMQTFVGASMLLEWSLLGPLRKPLKPSD